MKMEIFTIAILAFSALAVTSSKDWSVSGFDSGGFMATQMGFAFSS